MRISALSLGLLALLTPLTAAWTKEDREIFRVRDELIAHEGPDVTFYEFLGIAKGASHEDINKAYKKKARELHPDKVRQQLQAKRIKENKEKAKADKLAGRKPSPQVVKQPTKAELNAAIKLASERQSRLSIVADVLRGPGRDRYDYFLSNGFPTWKGTEYYYNRYRPGLGTAVFGVFLLAGGGAHYLALYMSWKRQREFVERYIKFARHAAWGENLGIDIPGVDAQPVAAPAPPPPQQVYEDEEGRQIPINRKMRRMQEREDKKDADKKGDKKSRSAAAAAGFRKTRGRGREPKSVSASASGSATPQPQGAGPTGAKKRVVAENGKVLVVDSLGAVFLEQEDEDGNVAEYLLDPTEIAQPTFKDTAVIRLPLWAYSLTVGRLFSKKSSDGEDDYEEEIDTEVVDDDEESEPGRATPSSGSAEDFELLEKSVDSLGQAKASGTQKSASKTSKRKSTKKR
ncbi:hypothetical protein QBC35DRAFT_399260 [Podospora australis]|uniref:J domain-containing protein n=1 Tax=Podospora australis TaxID=1536484 RepID=A0AAN7AMS6_9PEZI|nr:hypothetical protein QBC35DRAFT_399260 [Podospora australis]